MTSSPYIERVCDIDGWDNGIGLLAIIVRNHIFQGPGVNFITPPGMPQQVAFIKHPAGHEVPIHYHPQRERIVRDTQEVLIVKSGRVYVTIYFPRCQLKLKTSYLLLPGDIAILYRGAHSLQILDDAEILEIKQGPYIGKDADKVIIDPKQVKRLAPDQY